MLTATFQKKYAIDRLIYLSYNSHFFHTKTSILVELKYIIIFLISLLFNEMQHLKIG